MTGVVPPPDMRPQSWQQFLELCREVQDSAPPVDSHGGMLVTGQPLVDIVPVEPATMEAAESSSSTRTTLRPWPDQEWTCWIADAVGRGRGSGADSRQDWRASRLDQLPLNDPQVSRVQPGRQHRRFPDRRPRADQTPRARQAQRPRARWHLAPGPIQKTPMVSALAAHLEHLRRSRQLSRSGRNASPVSNQLQSLGHDRQRPQSSMSILIRPRSSTSSC